MCVAFVPYVTLIVAIRCMHLCHYGHVFSTLFPGWSQRSHTPSMSSTDTFDVTNALLQYILTEFNSARAKNYPIFVLESFGFGIIYANTLMFRV